MNKTFTEQIREAINTSGVTPYVLAKDAGISDSVLSRFLNGSGGLTLKTLDALAEVLGWEITQTVQRTSLPQPRGRHSGKGQKMNAIEEEKVTKKGTANKLTGEAALNMQETERYAKSAHEDHFSSHRGIWEIGCPDRIVVYNNHPYNDPAQRPAETASFREKLKELDIEELAYAEHGTEVPGGKYSYAMMLRVKPAQSNIVWHLMREAIRDARASLEKAAK